MTTLAPAPPGLEGISRLSLPQLCGQLLVVGFEGNSLPSQLTDALSSGMRAGVILFKRNMPTLEESWALCKEVARAAPPDLPPLIALDQEGGRVSRLPLPARVLPPMRALGQLGDLEIVKRAASIVGRGLLALGFNCNFAPVLDVDSNPDNPIIGDRSFSSEPHKVAHFGMAFARGLAISGILPCGKHFPGHGDTHLDSHLALPCVERAREQLDRIELLPFREAALQSLPAIMTAHVVFPDLDPTLAPATLSRPILTDLLRKDWGYQGLVFSDDLRMLALSAEYSLEESAKRAIMAGCDIVLICHDTDKVDSVLESLVDEAEINPEFSARILESAQRSLGARYRFRPRPALQGSAMRHALLGDESQSFFDTLDKRLADAGIVSP